MSDFDLDHLRLQTLARLVDVHPRTLARWRRTGEGPEFVRVGRSVRYPVSSVKAWLWKRRVSMPASADAWLQHQLAKERKKAAQTAAQG